jgi:hypothetical protein
MNAVGGPMVRVLLEPEVYDLIFTEGEPDGLWPDVDPAEAAALVDFCLALLNRNEFLYVR